MVIETQRGSIIQKARITDGIPPKVIHAAYGWWSQETGPDTGFEWRHSNFNMLTSMETLGTAFGTPNLKGIGCRVKPA